MENRCQRCNRELSDPNANYGWRCAEILGIDNLNSNLSSEYKIALANSIAKTENMMQGSNLNLSGSNENAFFNALLKQNFSNSIGRYDLEKEAREESFKILTTGRTNGNESSFNTWVAKLDNGYGDEETKSAKERTIEFGLSHPVIALSIGQFKSGSTNITTNAVRFATNEIGTVNSAFTNISSNSQRFADNSGLKESGSEGSGPKNAFRHVLWQATITKRFGIDIAREVGFAHEENPDALGDRYSIEHFKDVEFANSLKADEACDLLNNVQGRIVGITTPEKEMNKIALDVIDKYYTDGFWVSKHIGNGKYKITREKLTEKEYKKIKKNLECLNKNGFKK